LPILFRSLILSVVLTLALDAQVQAQAPEKAPLAASSSSLPDFLSRVRSAVRLEAGDSVMLHALAVRGLATDARIQPVKCGTGVLGHAHELTHTSKDTWAGKIQAATPGYNTKIVSPAGRFTVHYYSGDTASLPNATHDYASAVAQFADEAYDVEINELGYVKPPYSNADSTYHIYLLQLGASGAYGYTDEVTGGELAQSPSGLRRTRTFMVMDNDFADSIYVTRGLTGARITVFHEFHHMVQFGSYGRTQADSWFQEMTSTWMETVSDPSVRDYLQYVPNFIGNLTLQFNKSPYTGPYGQAIWLEYLAKKFDQAVVRDIWETYRDVQGDPIDAMARTLVREGSSFSCEYAKFGEELFFTGSRTRLKTPFANATYFPIDDMKVFRVAPGEIYNDIAFPTSLHLIAAGFGEDTVVLSIARDTAFINANIVSATIDSRTTYNTVYSDPARFCEAFGQPERTTAEVYPQPFILDDASSGVQVLVATDRLPVTTLLSIHSISMDEMIALEGPVETRAGGFYINWNGRDAAGKPVPSGVYLYTAEADGVERSGKIVVIRR
jgi:hypothetical protein